MAGVLSSSASDAYGYNASTPVALEYNGTLIGASAFLSVSTPAVFFAAGSSQLILGFLRRRVRSRLLTLAAAALPLTYAGFAARRVERAVKIANSPFHWPRLRIDCSTVDGYKVERNGCVCRLGSSRGW
jgi:hypothetical protein